MPANQKNKSFQQKRLFIIEQPLLFYRVRERASAKRSNITDRKIASLRSQ